MDRIVREMVSGRPVVIFSRSSCGISHSIKTLICEFGTNPCVYELDEMPKGQEIEQEIGQALSMRGCIPTVPAVFIGGQLVGGSKEIFSLHLNQALRPMLQSAGALWV